MKKYIYQLIYSLFIGSIFISCSEDYSQTDKGQDVLTLQITQEESVLKEINYSQEGISLSWTTGTNYGSGNRISYLLEIAKEGTGFSDAYSVDLGTKTYQWTKSVEELNNFLHEQLGVGYGEKVTLEARISAIVDGMEEREQYATVIFEATTYLPVTSTLYLVGDATPGSWSADDATAMELTSNGQFTWTGKLTAGSFKFITNLGEFLPSYNRDASAGELLTLIYRTSDDQPDEPFTINSEATYIVKADLLNLTLTLTETDDAGWRFDDFYMVGSFTGDNGWDFEPMAKDAVQINLFHHGIVIPTGTDGDFKFTAVNDFGQADAFFHPIADNATYASTSVVKGGDDNKWKMKPEECGKAYKILFNTAVGKEKMLMRPFTPYAGLFLVGDATPNGWSLDNATPMAKSAGSPYIFTWSGTLKSGEMKISCDKQSDWNGDWFIADKSGKTPTGEVETALFVSKADTELSGMYSDTDLAGLDNKWNIREEGSYLITIDQLKETISIVKQ